MSSLQCRRTKAAGDRGHEPPRSETMESGGQLAERGLSWGDQGAIRAHYKKAGCLGLPLLIWPIVGARHRLHCVGTGVGGGVAAKIIRLH